MSGLLGIAGGRNSFHVGVGNQLRKHGFTDCTRRQTEDKDSRFCCHG